MAEKTLRMHIRVITYITDCVKRSLQGDVSRCETSGHKPKVLTYDILKEPGHFVDGFGRK